MSKPKKYNIEEIDDKVFLDALNKSDSPAMLVSKLSALKDIPIKDAKLFVALKASLLRKTMGDAVVKKFPKGRKKIVASSTTPARKDILKIINSSDEIANVPATRKRLDQMLEE